MNTSLTRATIALTVAATLVTGCSFGSRTVRRKMGDTAPAFSKGGDLKGFVVGSWSLEQSDSDFSALFEKFLSDSSSQGYGKVAERSEDKDKTYISSLFEFQADGTFKVTRVSSKTEGGYETLGGTWAPQGQVVNLSYTTMNDKPIEQVKADVKASEERGTQAGVINSIILEGTEAYLNKRTTLRVAKDGRRLAFYSIPSTAEQMEQFQAQDLDFEELERLKVETVKN
jgi:hypothetical protein